MLPACPDPNQCWQQQGHDADGCQVAPVCAACCTCPSLADPVCGVVPEYVPANYQTYSNECEATCAGATVLHKGDCLAYEGMGCGYWGGGGDTSVCASGQYCRDTCPVCDSIQESRCSKIGACMESWDCPAGLSAACSPNQQPSWTCVDHACTFTCQ